MAPLDPPEPEQPPLLGLEVAPLGRRPGLRNGVAPSDHCPRPRALPFTSDAGWLLPATVPGLR